MFDGPVRGHLFHGVDSNRHYTEALDMLEAATESGDGAFLDAQVVLLNNRALCKLKTGQARGACTDCASGKRRRV